MSPVEKLEKYADSENIFNRQMVARTVLETLRQVLEDKEESLAGDVVRVFNVVELLARDSEPSVRAELMEQVSNFNRGEPFWGFLILFTIVSHSPLLTLLSVGSTYCNVLPGAGDRCSSCCANTCFRSCPFTPVAPGGQVLDGHQQPGQEDKSGGSLSSS